MTGALYPVEVVIFCVSAVVMSLVFVRGVIAEARTQQPRGRHARGRHREQS